MQLYSWADKLNLTDKSYLQYRGKRMVNIYEGLCFYLSLHKLYHYRNYVVDFASGVACSDIVRLAGYPLNKGSLILLKDIRQSLSSPAILGTLVLLGCAIRKKICNLLLL